MRGVGDGEETKSRAKVSIAFWKPLFITVFWRIAHLFGVGWGGGGEIIYFTSLTRLTYQLSSTLVYYRQLVSSNFLNSPELSSTLVFSPQRLSTLYILVNSRELS